MACCLMLTLAPSGCAQFVLLGLLIGGPPSIEPEFDRKTGDSLTGREAKVVVVCYANPKIKIKYSSIDREVALYVNRLMGQNRINVVEADYVSAWIDEHGEWETAYELAEHFEAEYVIEIELNEFDLYEKYSATLFRGTTLARVTVQKVDLEAGTSEQIFEKDLSFKYPTKVPRSIDEISEPAFKVQYLSRLGEEIGFMFYPYYNGDKISWAT